MAGLARPSERQDVDTPDDVGATSHYSLLIEWDPRDAIFFVVTVPELEGCRTHGATYEDAVAQQAQDAIWSWLDAPRAWGQPIPPPHTYAAPTTVAPQPPSPLPSWRRRHRQWTAHRCLPIGGKGGAGKALSLRSSRHGMRGSC